MMLLIAFALIGVGALIIDKGHSKLGYGPLGFGALILLIWLLLMLG